MAFVFRVMVIGALWGCAAPHAQLVEEPPVAPAEPVAAPQVEPEEPPVHAECADYCAAVVRACTSSYPSIPACLEMCKGRPWALGQAGEAAGNTLSCRSTWARRAVDDPTACGNAGVASAACDPCQSGQKRRHPPQSCRGYCDLMTKGCPDAFSSSAACEDACVAATLDAGIPGSRRCDSLGCRIAWAQDAVSQPSACVNAGLDSLICNPSKSDTSDIGAPVLPATCVVGIYDSSEKLAWMRKYRDTVFTDRIEPALKEFGLELILHDVHEDGLPEASMIRSCGAIVTLFLDAYLLNADAYSAWAAAQAKVGRKLVIFNNFGAYFENPRTADNEDRAGERANRVFSALGVSYRAQWSNKRRVLRIDNRRRTKSIFHRTVRFARTRFGPHYYLFRPEREDVAVHLWVTRRDIDNGKSAVVFTSPRGAMALTRYYDDPDGRSFINTPAFLKMALGLTPPPAASLKRR